jgi:hypothetical protein
LLSVELQGHKGTADPLAIALASMHQPLIARLATLMTPPPWLWNSHCWAWLFWTLQGCVVTR